MKTLITFLIIGFIIILSAFISEYNNIEDNNNQIIQNSIINIENQNTLSGEVIKNKVENKKKKQYNYITKSFFGNLYIEISLLILTFLFFIYIFSDFKYKKNKNINTIIHIVFYSCFILLCIIFKSYNYTLLIVFLIFFLSDFSFNYISITKKYINNKIKIRQVALILNFLSSIIIISLYFLNLFNIIYILILFFNIIFNFIINKKYNNIVSLFFSIVTLIFTIYILYTNF